MTDALCALFELSAVERERKAFVAGWRDGARYMADSGWDSSSDEWADEISRPYSEGRYPLPKEETI
jgi:hypothetical protein